MASALEEARAKYGAPKTALEEAKAKYSQPETSVLDAVAMGGGNAASLGLNDEAGGVLNAVAESGPGKWFRNNVLPAVADAVPSLGYLKDLQSPEIVRGTTREGKPLVNAAADAEEAKGFLDHYKEGRDEIRRVDAKAADEHAGAYYGTNVVASLAMPGAAGKAVSKLGKLGVAAGEAALTGLGNSTADLTKGDVGGAALDTAVGGALGAAAHGVGALVGKAFKPGKEAGEVVPGALERHGQESLPRKILNEVAEGEGDIKTTPTARKHLDKAEKNIVKEVTTGPEAEMVRDAYRGPAGAGRKKLAPVIDRVGKEIDSGYSEIENAGKHVVDSDALVSDLTEKAAEALKKGKPQQVKALKLMAQELAEMGAESGGKLDIRQVRGFTSEIQGRAASSLGGLNEHEGAKLKNMLSAVISERMSDILDKAVKGDAKLEEVASNIRKANGRYNALKTIDTALAQRQYKESSGVGALVKVAKALAAPGVGGVVGAAASGNDDEVGSRLQNAAIGAVGAKALPYLARKATGAILTKEIAASNLAKAIRSGDKVAEALLEAKAAGVPEKLVRMLQGLTASKVSP